MYTACLALALVLTLVLIFIIKWEYYNTNLKEKDKLIVRNKVLTTDAVQKADSKELQNLAKKMAKLVESDYLHVMR